MTFDAPDRTACTVKRLRTNTPLQALVLLNDQAYAEAATGLAQRMIREAGSKDPQAIAKQGFRLATWQVANDQQLAILTRVYLEVVQLLSADPELVQQRLNLLPKAFRDDRLPAQQVAAWFAVANVLLNLDQTITLN